MEIPLLHSHTPCCLPQKIYLPFGVRRFQLFRGYREKVELLRKKKMELKEARSAKRSRNSEHVKEKPIHEESSSDDDSDENFAVDWRAQHL